MPNYMSDPNSFGARTDRGFFGGGDPGEDHDGPENEPVICVACGKPGDPEEMNCPDAGWMHEACYDARYADAV